MSDHDGDGGQDDGGRDLEDIATVIRGYALGALAVPEDAFRVLGGWTDLPLMAAMEGRRFARSVFRAEANPYEIGGQIAFAAPPAPLPDVVRFRYEAAKSSCASSRGRPSIFWRPRTRGQLRYGS